MKQDNIVMGIDIGGSHITTGLVNMDRKEVIAGSMMRERVDCHGTAEEILQAWVNVIRATMNQYPGIAITRLGFAMPGPFDYKNGICLIKGFDKYEALYEWNIRAALAQRLQLQPSDICFRNDAEAFLEGELFCGAATGYTQAIGITLGTGLGSAYTHLGITADAEMSVLPYQGAIIEEAVSTRGLIRNYKQLTGITVKDAKAIADVYETDNNAVKAFDQFAADLTWFLEQFITRVSPDVLVIGGNIAQSWELFMPKVTRSLETLVTRMPTIVQAALGEDAALIGGACCFNQPNTTPNQKAKLKTLNS